MRWTTLLACLILPSMAMADSSDALGAYSFQSYGPEQGLRNQAVTSLAQDPAGFLYVGTEDGLFRYDGEHFQRLGVADGLPNDSVLVLHVTKQGQLWVGTHGGLAAWEGMTRARRAKQVLLPDQEVISIASSDRGQLLVSAWLSPDGSEGLLAVGGKLYRRDAAGRWASRKLLSAYAGEGVQALVKDRRGRIWLRGRQMLLRLERFDAPVQDLSASLPGAAVKKGELHLDAAGRIWVPTNHGVVFFDGNDSGLNDRFGLARVIRAGQRWNDRRSDQDRPETTRRPCSVALSVL